MSMANAGYASDVQVSVNVLLAGKWRPQILCVLRDGPVRLGQLSRLLPNASKKLLVRNLRELEASQIILRRDLSYRTLHVEYELNPRGKESVCATLNSLASWGHAYRADVKLLREYANNE